jgi:hypothetical protein
MPQVVGTKVSDDSSNTLLVYVAALPSELEEVYDKESLGKHRIDTNFDAFAEISSLHPYFNLQRLGYQMDYRWMYPQKK